MGENRELSLLAQAIVVMLSDAGLLCRVCAAYTSSKFDEIHVYNCNRRSIRVSLEKVYSVANDKWIDPPVVCYVQYDKENEYILSQDIIGLHELERLIDLFKQ